jgi:uncharacterized protein (TIGR02246 family)
VLTVTTDQTCHAGDVDDRSASLHEGDTILNTQEGSAEMPEYIVLRLNSRQPWEGKMKIRLPLVLVGLVFGFALPVFAQQKESVDPKVDQQIRELAAKFDEAFNKNDAVAVAALYTENGVSAFNTTSYGRQKIEKSYTHDFQRWHPKDHVLKINRLDPVGKDVRVIGRWSQTHVSDINRAPMYEEGYFTWIIVREGDYWKIRRSTFGEKNDPFSTSDG